MVMGAGRADARAFGVVMTGRNFGVLVGPVLLAQAVTLAGNWRFVWPLFGALTLIAGLAAIELARRLKVLARAS